MEEWRDIPGYEGYYQVSNMGNIRSIGAVDSKGRFRPPTVLHLTTKNTGYKRVQLCFGKPNSYNVHRLVAKAFPEICGEWFEKCEIDHINGVRDDNRAENLRVVSHAKNCNNPITLQKYHETGIKKGAKIDQFTLDGEIVKTWNSYKEIKRELGYWTSGIKMCCNGQLKSSYGYVWKFAS